MRTGCSKERRCHRQLQGFVEAHNRSCSCIAFFQLDNLVSSKCRNRRFQSLQFCQGRFHIIPIHIDHDVDYFIIGQFCRTQILHQNGIHALLKLPELVCHRISFVLAAGLFILLRLRCTVTVTRNRCNNADHIGRGQCTIGHRQSLFTGNRIVKPGHHLRGHIHSSGAAVTVGQRNHTAGHIQRILILDI